MFKVHLSDDSDLAITKLVVVCDTVHSAKLAIIKLFVLIYSLCGEKCVL